MNPTFSDFAALYDFTLIEQAVQAYFCDEGLGGAFVKPPDDDDDTRGKWVPEGGKIAFYTAYQAMTFQKCRPRVYIGGFSVSEIPNSHVIDANGVLRSKAWRGRMMIGVVTLPNYAQHIALRSAVLAILPQLQPVPVPDGSGVAAGGVNGFLQYHEVGQLAPSDLTTHITPEDGNYHSPINVALTFSVRATAWPGEPWTALPALPFKVVNGQLIPVMEYDAQGNPAVVRVWDAGAQAFRYVRSEHGQLTVKSS